MSKPQRLTKEEVLRRSADNWYKFRDKLNNIEYKDYIAECLKEFEYQNSLSDADLIKYREKGFVESVNETRKTFSGECEVYDKKEEQFNKKTSEKSMEKK